MSFVYMPLILLLQKFIFYGEYETFLRYYVVPKLFSKNKSLNYHKVVR